MHGQVLFESSPEQIDRNLLQTLIARHGKRVRLRPWNDHAHRWLKSIEGAVDAEWVAAARDMKSSSLPMLTITAASPSVDIDLLFYADGSELAAALTDYIDRPSACVVALKTDYYFKVRQHYIISVPKSGTHLLFSLLDGLGIRPGNLGEPEIEEPGTWKFLADQHSHTTFGRFLSDQQPVWGSERAHPFFRNPALFIYRNPLDVLVSEASFLRKSEVSPFTYVFAGLPEDELVDLLLDGPMGILTDRILPYWGWMYCPNTIALSFEELIGPEGGGSDSVQKKLMWSVALKLQTPIDLTRPSPVFDRSASTFKSGIIGRYKAALADRHYKRLRVLEDLSGMMAKMGYSNANSIFPSHADKFRHRPLYFPTSTTTAPKLNGKAWGMTVSGRLSMNSTDTNSENVERSRVEHQRGQKSFMKNVDRPEG